MAQANVCFEVYTRVNGRWELYANHVGQAKQEAALEEAKQLERLPHIQAVKVVKETFDPATNLTQEVSLYFRARSKDSSPDLNKAEPTRFSPPGGGRKVGSDNRNRNLKSGPGRGAKTRPQGQSSTRRPAAKKPQKNYHTGNLIKKLLVVLVVSIAAGILFAGITQLFINKSGGEPGFAGSFPFLAFALTFVFFLIGASWMFFNRAERDALLREKSQDEHKEEILSEVIDLEEERRRDMAGQEEAEQKIEEDGGVDFLSETDEGLTFLEEDDLEELQVQAPDEEEKAEAAAAGDYNEEAEKLLAEINAELDAEENGEDQAAAAAAEEAAKKKKKAEEGEESDLTEFDENIVKEATVAIMKFMQSALPYAMQNSQYANGGNFDAYNLFGCHLYLAGAADGFCQRRKLRQDLHKPILEKVSQAFSRSKQRARSFAAAYDEYLLDEKNQEMFRSGRESMSKYIGGEKEAPGRVLTWALDNWNQRKQQNKQPVAVMFTDIVGSTQFTQDHGDEESHKLVTAHNAIVREALRYHSGREVKHTGDGIMASFANPAQAVPCSVAIMRGAAMHNQMNPQRPIHLRVSINAGEPIEEGGDFFGATVQLSARINAVCNTDQILVSDVMSEFCKDGKYQFRDFGKHKFKGFKDPIQVFEVPWQGGSGMAAAS